MVQIYKFGGSSTSSEKSISRLVEITSQTQLPIVLTISAASGVSNRLRKILSEKLDQEIIYNLIDDLRELHVNLLPESVSNTDKIEELLSKIQKLLFGVLFTEELTPRTHDLLLTFGERIIVLIVKEYFNKAGISCTITYPEDLIITDGVYFSSLVLLNESQKMAKTKLQNLLKKFDVILVPGFYGVSKDNKVTLFGRSGTDYSATVLSYILDASSVTIWKDTNGFMTADPKIVPTAITIPRLSYDEAAELAYFGAALLHSRAIGPSRLKKIPVNVRNVNDLDATTSISEKTDLTLGVIKSISHMVNLSVVKVYTSVEGNYRGRFAAISKQIEESSVNIISIATSQTCIAFLIKRNGLDKCIAAVKSLGPAIVDDVEVDENISLVCLVGKGLGETPGIASRVFGAMSREKINVELISAGASTCAFHFTVKEEDLDRAILAFHHEFFSSS